MSRGLAIVLALAPALTAQGPKRAQAGFLEEQLQKAESELAQTESRLHRLEELRVRLALGLPVTADRYLELGPEELALAASGGQDRLSAEQTELQRLSRLATDLERESDRIRRESRGRRPGLAPTEGAQGGMASTSLPGAGAGLESGNLHGGALGAHAMPPDRPLARWSLDETPAESESEPTQREPESRPAMQDPKAMPGGMADSSAEPPDDETSRVIVGSENRANVARLLLRSGERALLRAEREGFAADDPEHARALERIRTARDEFAKLVEASGEERADLSDLYHLARAEEKLGNRAAADSHYTEIVSRDRMVTPEGVETYGRWGRAAQAAKAVLRWVSDTGSWDPDIESIRWNRQ